MARKPKAKPPPRPDSVSWTEYGPGKAAYWMYGGPWIAPEDIPPEEQSPEHMGGGMKGDGRKRYLNEIVEAARADQERQTTKYLALHEKGMEAVEGWIAESWRQRVHCGSAKAGEPDPVSEQLASCYRSIRWSKGRIIAGGKALDGMERNAQPLFHWKD